MCDILYLAYAIQDSHVRYTVYYNTAMHLPK